MATRDKKSLKKIYKYMHTINGSPARYNGYQICYAGKALIPLVDTLKQIKKERRASENYRVGMVFTIRRDYGHVKIQTEEHNG